MNPASCGPTIGDADLDAALQQLGPQGAGGAARLLAQLLDPALQVDALAARISADPGLALRVLRVANAPYYGRAGAVASVDRAAHVLGTQTLRGIAAAACFGQIGAAGKGVAAAHLAALNQHSLATACAAQAVARRLAPALAEQAFMAGLVHDVGWLLLWRLQAAGAIDACNGPGESGAGPSHSDCGRRLLAAWHMPAELCEVAAAHHGGGLADPSAPPSGATPVLCELVALGDALACAAGAGLAWDPAPPALPAGGPWSDACSAAAAEWPAAAQALASALQR